MNRVGIGHRTNEFMPSKAVKPMANNDYSVPVGALQALRRSIERREIARARALREIECAQRRGPSTTYP